MILFLLCFTPEVCFLKKGSWVTEARCFLLLNGRFWGDGPGTPCRDKAETHLGLGMFQPADSDRTCPPEGSAAAALSKIFGNGETFVYYSSFSPRW